MKSNYLKTISIIHTAYNVLEKGINLYDYTFYNLCIILLRKESVINFNQNNIELTDGDLKEVLSERIFQKFKSLDQNIFNPNLVPFLSDGLELIFIIEDNIFNKHYKEYTDLCISLMLKGNDKNTYDAFQPKELTQLMNYFLPEDKNISVYNPFAGLCSLGVNLINETKYFAEEINHDLIMLAELKFLIFDRNNFKIETKNSIQSLVENTTDEYDFITFNPPFNLKLSEYTDNRIIQEHKFFSRNNGNGLIISETFRRLKVNGKMVVVMPDSFLFSSIKKEKDLRKYLVENNYIKYIIKLPSKIFDFSSISINLIVLEKGLNKKGEINLVDASSLISKSENKNNSIDFQRIIDVIESKKESDFFTNITSRDIIKNDYNLSVGRYFLRDLGLEESKVKNLVNFDSLISSVKREKNIKRKGKFLKIGDLSNDKLDYIKTFEEIKERDLRIDANLLYQDSLLLSLAFKDLKPTFFTKTKDEIYYPFNNILACIVNTEKVDIDYLVLEFHKEYVKKQLSSRRVGSAILRIGRKDLLNLQIVLPPIAEQLKEVYRFKDSIINQEKNKYSQLVRGHGIEVADENSFLRHQIAGSLKNVRGTFSAIKQIINEQIVSKLPEALDLKRSPKLETTLFDYLNILERDITNINKTVNIVGQEIDLTDLKVSKFNMLDFLTNYVNEVENRGSNLFTISLDLDQDLLIDKQVKGIFVNGDKEFLRRIFNNIIENAEKHGFNNTINPKNKIEIDIQYDFDDLEIQVDFGNTGNPLPEDYSHEAFIRKGSKTGKNAGNGVGGWFINEVMKLHNGKFGFTDETGPEGIFGEMITTIELTFPIELKI